MDARNALSATKHYINTPMPLFQYLCTLDISRSHEHVFLLHWCEGQIRGDWKSQIPISCVASRLSLSESTVKRAYRELAQLGLIRRHSQGRCRYNPMRSDVTVTEVTIPEAVAEELLNARNRAASKARASEPAPVPSPKCTSPKPQPMYEALHDESDCQTIFAAKSKGHKHERNERERISSLAPATTDHSTPLQSRSNPSAHNKSAKSRMPNKEGGRIASWFATKLRRALRERLDEARVEESWHQILWSIGHGSLSEQPLPKAFNVAMKLLRQNRWMTPWDMPDGWKWSGA